MAWIESHQSLRDHPKTRKLSRILGTSLPATIGHLQCLWWWAVDYAEDGALDRHDAIDLAIGGEWDGDPDQFVDALVTVGFLDRDGDSLVIHDWDNYAGKLIERRKANAERMRVARAGRNQDTSSARAEENSERATHVQRTQRARAERPNSTEHNTTEPNRTEPEDESARDAQANAPTPTPGADAPPTPEDPPPTRTRGMRLPESFAVTPAMRKWAHAEGLDDAMIDRETEKFRDYWRAESGQKAVKLDWVGAWRNWMRRSLEIGGSPGNLRHFNPRAPAMTAQERTKAAFDEVFAELSGEPPPDHENTIETRGVVR